MESESRGNYLEDVQDWRLISGQYGGSPIKVGEDEYSLFRDHELLAKINE